MFKNASIKSFLTLTSIVLIAVGLIFVFVLWHAFAEIQTAMIVDTKQQNLAQTLKNVRFHTVQIQQFLTDVGASRDEGGFAEAKANLQQSLTGLDSIIQQKPEISSRCESIKKQVQSMHDSGVKMALAYINEGTEAGNAMMKQANTGLDAVAENMTAELDNLTQLVDAEQEVDKRRLEAAIKQDSLLCIGLAICLVLFVIIALILIYLKIEPPLSALKNSLSTIKQGGADLTRRIPHEQDDEIGEIVTLFNDFLIMLQSLMQQVLSDADQISLAADRFKQLSQQNREGLEKQQIGANQVADTVKELSATVNQVAGHTGHAAGAASQSSVAANDGRTVIGRAVETIHALSEGLNQASSVIGKVEADCENVSKVLDVIQNIADQTNLLALNAAIEAARAGDQGRGFAVVADEVRTLASRTQDSTHEIQQMIEQLQRGSKNAVAAMIASQDQAGQAVGVIESTGQLLEDISRMAIVIAEMNGQISTAVDEQLVVVAHINQNVTAIHDVTLDNARDAEQADQEAESLQNIAGHLQASIAKFKV